MKNNKNVIKAFLRVLPKDPGWVVVHSSLIHLNVKADEFKWEFLKTIKELVDEGYTFAFPAFTFSFCSSGKFNLWESKSEVGILADWVLDLYGASRTRNPVYSHVIIGPESRKALNVPAVSCFGTQSIYNFFERNNVTVCMFGCSWNYCAPFHYYEEKFQVPYRYHKDFVSTDDPEIKATMYVRDTKINPINDFTPAIEELGAQGLTVSSEDKENFIESTSFENINLVCSQHLSNNIYSYLSNSKIIQNAIAEKSVAASTESIKVAILANSNFEQLENIFKEVFAKFCPMRQLYIFQNSYNQLESDIYSGKINDLSLDYCFLPSRLEDIYKVGELEFADIYDHSPLDSYINIIKKINDQIKMKAFVHLFPILATHSTGSVLFEQELSPYEFIQQANLKLIEQTKDLKNIKLVAPEMMTSQQLTFDPRLWYLGRLPYSADILQGFAEKYCGYILNYLGKTTRLLVLDLDNTLWGGVLGEDGINGISLGGDFPGNSFKDFQKTIISLKDRGIALAIASKNDEETAFNCIENHPDMLIKKDDLAAYKINWQEKYINIKEISQELGLSLANIMLVDDNPVEREKVRVNLPEVKVLELPQDSTLYRQTILDSPFLAVTEITDEDKKRSKNYTKQRMLATEQDKFENIEDFLSSLKITVQFNKLNDYNFARTLQLINKTNQFNTTTKRYAEKDLHSLQNDDNFFVGVVGYSDRMTEYENIGVFILEQTEDCINISSLLLSCRVLGKGLEDAIVAWIVDYSHSKGLNLVCGEIVETPRNTPARDVYDKLGFTKTESMKWCHQTSNKIKTPAYIELIED